MWNGIVALAEWSIGFAGVERVLAKNQNEIKTEYNNFVQRLSVFANQEITQFRHKLMLLGGTSQNIQNTSIQVREIAQDMSERVDKVEQQMESIYSGQKEEADRVVQYRILD